MKSPPSDSLIPSNLFSISFLSFVCMHMPWEVRSWFRWKIFVNRIRCKRRAKGVSRSSGCVDAHNEIPNGFRYCRRSRKSTFVHLSFTAFIISFIISRSNIFKWRTEMSPSHIQVVYTFITASFIIWPAMIVWQIRRISSDSNWHGANELYESNRFIVYHNEK